MIKDRKLRYWAATLALGQMSAEEIHAWADELLESGTYQDEFIAILDSKPPRLAEVKEPFVRALAKLGYSLPDKQTALWRVIDYLTEEIAGKRLDPLTGVQRLYDEISLDMPDGKAYVWDTHDVSRMCGLFWEIRDTREAAFDDKTHQGADAEIQMMLDEVIKESIRWQAAHGEDKS